MASAQADFLELIDTDGQYAALIQETRAAINEGEQLTRENLLALQEAVQANEEAYQGLSD